MIKYLFLLISFPLIALSQQRIKNIVINDSIEVTFILIPAGSFTMGSTPADPHAQKDEFPAFEVTISSDYYLAQTEVTQRLWESLMGYNPSVFQHPNKPVDMISWPDAQKFVKEINKLDLGSFRLPTEAEWEYACKMGEPEYRNSANEIIPWKLGQFAWFYPASEGKSHQVATRKIDRMGLFDMQGSVWEWCSDWIGPYTAEPKTDPKGPSTGKRKAYKGGSWFNEPQAMRPANRHGHEPHDSGGPNSGIRLLLEVE